ncbi:MAG: hypothetical protein JSS31_00175 [Proteobacteria bacterium]|nr:hypothetical protein [Pseudomonadota bacterium]MBS0492368.1 hypothetical protein [Pseudomonadota bacterium]
MTSTEPTMLRLEDHCTTLAHGTGPEEAIGVGIRDIAERHFRHEPPTSLEMEQAIDVVEDALAATGLRHAARGELLSSDPRLHALLGLTVDGARLAREDVEDRFQRLASATLGLGAVADRSVGRDAAAALLILRECMHHLGYEAVRRVR